MFAVDPQIVIYPNDTEILAGSTLILSCTGYGIPLPSIVWRKAGLELSEVNNSRVTVWEETVAAGEHTFTRSYLQMCSTVELDSGLYNCSAVTAERENGVEFGVTIVGVPPTLIITPGQ